MTGAKAGRVLVVDDDEALRRSTRRVLEKAGHEVVEAGDGLEAIACVRESVFDLVLTDLSMPGMNGLELLRAIRERDPDVPVVLVTGTPSVQSAIEALEHGAAKYMVKPVANAELTANVARAINFGRLARAKREALTAGAAAATYALGDRASLEGAFDRAMKTMWSAFQPIVRVDGSPFGHEALLRSREPALPHPGAVLDAAERLDRIHVLGRHMRALAALAVAGDPGSGVLFVNLHPRDLFDEELTSETSPLMAIADRVVLEVTERAAIENMGQLRTRTAEIRARGFRIAIDDLGAGYAGLSAFAALEPEVVKLDMTLIRGIEAAPTQRKVVASVTRMCRDLGMLVVAEGVETTAELRCVIDTGCDLVQGYLLAKPGPAFPTYTWPELGAG